MCFLEEDDVFRVNILFLEYDYRYVFLGRIEFLRVGFCLFGVVRGESEREKEKGMGKKRMGGRWRNSKLCVIVILLI